MSAKMMIFGKICKIVKKKVSNVKVKLGRRPIFKKNA